MNRQHIPNHFYLHLSFFLRERLKHISNDPNHRIFNENFFLSSIVCVRNFWISSKSNQCFLRNDEISRTFEPQKTSEYQFWHSHKTEAIFLINLKLFIWFSSFLFRSRSFFKNSEWNCRFSFITNIFHRWNYVAKNKWMQWILIVNSVVLFRSLFDHVTTTRSFRFVYVFFSISSLVVVLFLLALAFICVCLLKCDFILGERRRYWVSQHVSNAASVFVCAMRVENFESSFDCK